MYSVSELSKFVGKSENFVRQHINRGHLHPQKDGRRIYVTSAEALRWCEARGLTLNPESISVVDPSTCHKVGRLTVLGFRCSNGKLVNAFTLLRTRRRENLGPWKPTFTNDWKSEKLGCGFELFTLDAEIDECEEWISTALSNGTVMLGEDACRYDLLSVPRSYWAYREHRGDHDAPIQSPFTDHSAEIREHWSRDSDIRREIAEAVDALPRHKFKFETLGFPLRDRPDRLGNLIVASAWDLLKYEMSVDHSGTLATEVTGEPRPGEYVATVWAAQNGDQFFHQWAEVKSGRSTIGQSIVADRIGFELFRTSDGQCVDRMDVNLIREISIGINMSSGTTINLMDEGGNSIHTIDSGSYRSSVVASIEDAAEIDSIVRSRKLGFHAYRAETVARRENRIKRFSPGEFNEAVAHFVQLLGKDADLSDPIYLADRYFVDRIKSTLDVRLYYDMLSAIEGRELRVLCTQSPGKHEHRWWETVPERFIRYLKVRCFRTNEPNRKPAFHDRYLITARHETSLSHSLNGWAKGGVTFATFPFDVYRTEAEYFWSIPLGSSRAPLFVEEYV